MEGSTNKFTEEFRQKLNSLNTPGKVKERISSILCDLESPGKLKISDIKKQAFRGCPENLKGLRPHIWKILLGYIGLDGSKWEEELTTKRDEYHHLRAAILGFHHLNPKFTIEEIRERQTLLAKFESGLGERAIAEYLENNPAELEKMSERKWGKALKLACQWQLAELDVQRTKSDMNYFSMETSTKFPDDLLILSSTRILKEKAHNGWKQTHRDILTRILVVFMVSNKAIGYFQGMNELVAVIYYNFSTNDPNQESVEADTFWCFFYLIAAYKDQLARGMGSEGHPIQPLLKLFEAQAYKALPSVVRRLRSLDIEPEFYAYRWIVLFFAQEFNMAEVLRLWDSLLCFFHPNDKKPLNSMIISIATALLALKGRELMKGTMGEVLKVLQTSMIGVDEVLIMACKVFKKLHPGKTLHRVMINQSL